MKYIAACVLGALVLFAYLNVSVQEAHAFGSSHPFGGLVTITTMPDVVCNSGTGPVTISPVGSSVTTPYFFPTSSRGAPAEGQWVLGNYDETQDTESCKTTGSDSSPYPVYRVTLFGHSGSSGIGSIFTSDFFPTDTTSTTDGTGILGTTDTTDTTSTDTTTDTTTVDGSN